MPHIWCAKFIYIYKSLLMVRPRKHWESNSSGSTKAQETVKLYVHKGTPVRVVITATEISPLVPARLGNGNWGWKIDGNYINLPIEHKTVSPRVFALALAKYKRDHRPESDLNGLDADLV